MYTYDLKKIQTLLKDFHELTNVKICLYDTTETELCFYPQQLSGFCSLLRKNEEMRKRCLDCDKRAFSECKKTYSQYTYTCHAGLLECISPILYQDKIVGYIVLGQMKSTNCQFKKFTEIFTDKELQLLEREFKKLPTLSHEKVNAAVHVLDACTGYEYLKGLIRSYDNKIDTALRDFINQNLSQELSVKILCSKFHLSHNEIYSIFKEYFCATPAEYIKTRRLFKACELLKNTSLSVNKIAIQCGIPDYNYFSKVFKHTFGVSPRMYRKQ